MWLRNKETTTLQRLLAGQQPYCASKQPLWNSYSVGNSSSNVSGSPVLLPQRVTTDNNVQELRYLYEPPPVVLPAKQELPDVTTNAGSSSRAYSRPLHDVSLWSSSSITPSGPLSAGGFFPAAATRSCDEPRGRVWGAFDVPSLFVRESLLPPCHLAKQSTANSIGCHSFSWEPLLHTTCSHSSRISWAPASSWDFSPPKQTGSAGSIGTNPTSDYPVDSFAQENTACVSGASSSWHSQTAKELCSRPPLTWQRLTDITGPLKCLQLAISDIPDTPKESPPLKGNLLTPTDEVSVRPLDSTCQHSTSNGPSCSIPQIQHRAFSTAGKRRSKSLDIFKESRCRPRVPTINRITSSSSSQQATVALTSKMSPHKNTFLPSITALRKAAETHSNRPGCLELDVLLTTFTKSSMFSMCYRQLYDYQALLKMDNGSLFSLLSCQTSIPSTLRHNSALPILLSYINPSHPGLAALSQPP